MTNFKNINTVMIPMSKIISRAAPEVRMKKVNRIWAKINPANASIFLKRPLLFP
jgi:hypothetical protein